jgi:excisionase family DNA binding protein
MKIYKITEASGYLGVSINTLKTLANNGKIKSFKTTGEHRRFRQEDLDTYMGVEKEKQEKLTVIYARCSTAKQKENLERQKDRLRKHAEVKGYKYVDIRMAAIFNEWARRYSENPDEFGEVFDGDGNPLEDYGKCCAAYFRKIASDLDARWLLPTPTYTNPDYINPAYDKITIGACSICSGPVSVPAVWHGIIPPRPTCEWCGAIKVDDCGPVLPMIPNSQRTIIKITDNTGAA